MASLDTSDILFLQENLPLAFLVLAAGGGDSGLGQEEFSAGADADLVETLSISGNALFAQGKPRHSHRLSVQHQLQGEGREKRAIREREGSI